MHWIIGGAKSEIKLFKIGLGGSDCQKRAERNGIYKDGALLQNEILLLFFLIYVSAKHIRRWHHLRANQYDTNLTKIFYLNFLLRRTTKTLKKNQWIVEKIVLKKEVK